MPGMPRPPISHRGRTIRTVCGVCQFPLLGQPVAADDHRLFTRFFAAQDHEQVTAGQVIRACPKCGTRLSMPWDEFEASMADAYGP